jgi:hypothetical protein
VHRSASVTTVTAYNDASTTTTSAGKATASSAVTMPASARDRTRRLEQPAT